MDNRPIHLSYSRGLGSSSQSLADLLFSLVKKHGKNPPLGAPGVALTKAFESEDDVANVIGILDGSELKGNTCLGLSRGCQKDGA